jgi:hypothetical protein
MKPRPELLAVYSATAYIVHFEDHDYTIRIGDACTELDDLMIQHEVGTWTFITAYNPLSEKLSAKENEKLNEKLAAELLLLELQTYPATSVADKGDWPDEKSFLVLGLNLEQATQLGFNHGQHAIVFGRFNKPAQLVWCRE